MARKSGANSKKQESTGIERRHSNFSQSIRWINPYLDQDDQKWLQDNFVSIAGIVFDFLDALPDTVNLSSKFDARSDRWLATLIYTPDDPITPNVGISMRAATRFDALYALAYVVVEKFAEGLPTDDAAPQGRWG